MIRVGIVGTGVGIRTHLAGLQRVPRAEVIGVVGSSVDRTREHLRRTGFDPSLACDWRTLLLGTPDLLCLTTPPNERWPYVKDLDGFPGHLLIEKPVTLNSRESAEMRRVLGEVVARSFTNFQLRGLGCIKYVRSLVASGALGSTYYVRLFERTAAFRQSTIPTWMQSNATGGGQIYAMGSHLVDLGVFLSGASYGDVTPIADSAYFGSPLQEWKMTSVAGDRSDEFFGCALSAGQTHMEIFTTCVSPAERTLRFQVEGTLGSAEFQYQNGGGKLHVSIDGAEEQTLLVGEAGEVVGVDSVVPKLDNSAFRIAYPAYMNDLCESIVAGSGHAVATLEDGIGNVEILSALLSSH